MYRDKYFRDWTGPFPFTPVAVITAPATPGAYMLLYLREIVYVGISTRSIRTRLTRHVNGHGNWAAALRAAADGYEFVYFQCDGLTARQIESNIITNDKPPFNVKPEYLYYVDNITVH